MSFSFLMHRSPWYFFGELAGTEMQGFVLGAPNQDGNKT